MFNLFDFFKRLLNNNMQDIPLTINPIIPPILNNIILPSTTLSAPTLSAISVSIVNNTNLITPTIKTRIEHVLNAMETGSAEGNYADVTILHDGPGNTRQVTYGRSQTTETGNLRKLIIKYVENNGKYAKDFIPYIDGKGNNEVGTNRLVDDSTFINLLEKSAKEDPIMISTQDTFFDDEYWMPARLFFDREDFTLPLSMLVIYDSYIQSGRIFDFLRNQFPENAPIRGGNEKQWIKEYCAVRYDWMSHHERSAVRASVYRVNDYKKMMLQNNWMLDILPLKANGVNVV